jgi:hypothetical protein
MMNSRTGERPHEPAERRTEHSVVTGGYRLGSPAFRNSRQSAEIAHGYSSRYNGGVGSCCALPRHGGSMWKQVDQFEWDANAKSGRGYLSLYGRLDKMMDRHTRVTVEEEVPECCEKWRGKLVGNDACRDGSVWLQVRGPATMEKLLGPVFFCPECGGRL